MMKARVSKSTGSWYQVETEDGSQFQARIVGKFRQMGIRTTNPVAVGDWVNIEIEHGQDTAVITELHDRKNYIIRKSINLSHKSQIIAANIDQALLIVTLASPPTSFGFIDRFLVTAEAYGIPTTLLFNKLDLFSEEGEEVLQEYMAIYSSIGYTCLPISALNGTHLDLVQKMVKDKTTLISGHSGVGKSTLINQLTVTSKQKTGEISDWSDKGKHTTTFAEMLDLKEGGKIIDTPGIQEFGLIDLEKQELSFYFPEMRKLLNQCKFHNCRHINEPGCVVLEEVESGQISPTRYESYLSIYHGNETRI